MASSIAAFSPLTPSESAATPLLQQNDPRATPSLAASSAYGSALAAAEPGARSEPTLENVSGASPEPAAMRPHSALSAGSAGGTPQRPRSKSGTIAEVGMDERAMRGEEILHALFNLPGLHLADDFSCAFADGLLLLHGRLYVTDRAVLFASSIFGKETRKILPFASMVSVDKAVSGLIIPALKFTMQRRGEPGARTVLLFTSFFAGKRDKAYELVARLQQAAARRNGGPGTPAGATLLSAPEPSISRLSSSDGTSGGAAATVEDASAPTLSVTPQLVGDVASRGSSALGSSFGSSIGSYGGSSRAAEVSSAAATTRSGAGAGEAGTVGSGPSAFAVAATTAQPSAQRAGESNRSDASAPDAATSLQQPSAQRPVVLVGESGVDGSSAGSRRGAHGVEGRNGVPPLRSPRATTVAEAAAAGSTPGSSSAGSAASAASSAASRPRRGTESRPLPVIPADFLQSRLGHKEAKLVLDTVLPMPPQAFFEAFLSDAATFSMADAHRARGDFAVHCGDWAPVSPAEGSGSSSSGGGGAGASMASIASASSSASAGTTSGAAASASASVAPLAHARTVRLRMPLEPVPFCPRETAVEKVQQLTCFAGPSWVLETSARSFDVPYAETFLTTDCVLACPHDARVPWAGKELPPPAEVAAAVRAHRSACAAAGARSLALPSSPTPPMTRLVVIMRVDFLKSTIFKGRIASKAEEGVAAFFGLFLEKARAHAASHVLPRLLAELSEAESVLPLNGSAFGPGGISEAATMSGSSLSGALSLPSVVTFGDGLGHSRGATATSSYLSPTMAAAMANPALALPIEPIMAAYPAPVAAAALASSDRPADREALLRSYSQLYAAHAAAVNQLRRLQGGSEAGEAAAAEADASIGAAAPGGVAGSSIVSARGGSTVFAAWATLRSVFLRYAKTHPVALLAFLMAVIAVCVSAWSAVQANAAVDAQAASAASGFGAGESAGASELGAVELQQLEARVMARLLAEMRAQTGSAAAASPDADRP